MECQEEHQERQYIVHSDNITVGYQRLGTKVLTACSGPELLKKICNAYEFPWPMLPGHEIQIWSATLGMVNRIRLDKLEQIPPSIQEVWIYATGSVGRGF
jgi:hypothetical protein